MDINCKKCECVHNKSCSCCAKRIKVGSKVDCETYEYSEKNAQDLKQQTAKNMFEISNQIQGHIANKGATIYCDAICLFNKEGICKANGISVLEKNGKTPFCATQIKP